MNAIEKSFAELKERGRKAFIAYLTAGDPDLGATVRLVLELAKNGVDMVELGVPFSDPVADGPVNQEAAIRALRNGATLSGILDAVRRIRESSSIPVILFAYCNTILQYGLARFAADAVRAGVDGVLVLDFPPEEAADYKVLMDGAGLATIFLVSPVTSEERIDCIARYASGFVYYVSQMGVTGMRDAVGGSVPDMVARIRRHTSVPVAVGFGISTPDQVRQVAEFADGVIVGSAIVRKIGESGGSPGFETAVGAYAAELTAPLKGP
jgi:tryptophan synthase alpha chain